MLIRDDGVEIPFLFRIWPYGTGSALINGTDTTPLELVPGDWSALTVGVCDVNATIAWRLPDEAADAESRQTQEGEYVRIGDDGEVVRMEARATLGHDIDPIRRCPFLRRSDLNMRSEPLPRGPRVTRWRMEFSESGPATGVLTLSAWTPSVDMREFVAEVEILTADGESKRLYGSKVFWAPHSVRYEFELSYFDGASALLIRGEADSGLERMTGEFFSGPTSRETFTATRLR
ncbi:MAG: hypothetical protein EA376_13355 [Phycisphaeraceae bacterium]|nr:MAG: hypothetical protein EA376_13355 [Phycisphaeraceae bacterium]